MIGARNGPDDAPLSAGVVSRRALQGDNTSVAISGQLLPQPLDDGIPLGDRSLPRPAQHQEPDAVRTSSMLIRTTIIRSRSCWRILR